MTCVALIQNVIWVLTEAMTTWMTEVTDHHTTFTPFRNHTHTDSEHTDSPGTPAPRSPHPRDQARLLYGVYEAVFIVLQVDPVFLSERPMSPNVRDLHSGGQTGNGSHNDVIPRESQLREGIPSMWRHEDPVIDVSKYKFIEFAVVWHIDMMLLRVTFKIDWIAHILLHGNHTK